MRFVPTPSAERGATTRAMPMTYVPPGREPATPPDAPGVNVPFVLDKLSEILTHERCGAHLYRSVAARTNNPMLKARYEEFGRETEDHTTRAAELIAAFGGDPMFVSPPARATEGMDAKLLESTFLLEGSVDLMTAEMVMLTAVFIAESVDHANWATLAATIDALPDGETKDRAAEVVSEVVAEEDEHLEWARTMRQRMTIVQASSSMLAGAGLKAEEALASIKGWFS